jgi:hypothetical protein
MFRDQPVYRCVFVPKHDKLILHLLSDHLAEVPADLEQLITVAEQSEPALCKSPLDRLKYHPNGGEVCVAEGGYFQASIVEQYPDSGPPMRAGEYVGKKADLIIEIKFIPLFGTNKSAAFI